MRKFKAITLTALTMTGAVVAANGVLSGFSQKQVESSQSKITTARRISASELEFEDYTSRIVNPTIEQGNDFYQIPTGWTGITSSWRWTQDTGSTFMEAWNSTGSELNFNMYQTITDLPNGIYRITAEMFNSTNGEEGAVLTGGECGLYAISGNIMYYRGVYDDTDILNEHSIMAKVVDNMLTIGVKNISTPTARWFGCDNFTLAYYGGNEEIDLTAENEKIIPYNYPDWASTNHGHSSSSSYTWTITTTGGEFSFDYSVSSESGCDILSVRLNDAEIVNISGENAGTYSSELEAGSYTLTATYYKDGSVSNGLDMATVTNITVPLSAAELLEQFRMQVNIADSVLANISYPKVPGYTDLQILSDSARSIESMSDDEIDAARLLFSNLRALITTVESIDSEYVRLNAAADSLLQHAQENPYVNLELLAQATAYTAELKEGLNNGAFGTGELIYAFDTLVQLGTRLAYTHLDIYLREQGSLGDSILAKVENFTDVQSLRLSGRLNSDDMATLKNRLTSIFDLDLAGLDWKNMPERQFENNSVLQRIVLPANMETIGSYAFQECRNLVSVVTPQTLKSVGYRAFRLCTNLPAIEFPEGFTSLGEESFAHTAIHTITFPSTLATVSRQAFYDVDNLQNIVFSQQTTIGDETFIYCDGIKEVVFPTTLTNIGTSAFYYCQGLSSVVLNEGLTSIGDYAFYNCNALTEITLPSTLQTLNGYYAFRDCDNLTRVTCNTIVPPYVNNNNVTGKSGLDLYVPQLSVNVYKQTSGWDQFNIHGINVMPDNIVIRSDYNLNWPDSLNIDYKPNVTITDRDNSQYGSLTVNGNSTLSAGQFTIKYDPNIAHERYYYDAWDNYTHNRYSFASLVNNANVRADEITIEYWLRSNSWEFVTIPFDVKVADIRKAYDGTPFVIRKYDGEKRAAGLTGETWVDMTADSILHAGEGYIWRSASTESNRYYTGFYLDALQTVNKNKIFANNDVEVPLNYYESEFAHNRSWNLIGNPYPCFYDIRTMQTSAPITVWDTYQNNYRAYSPEDDAYILNPGQAFFVQRPVDEESITFLKEGRQTNLTVRSREDLDYTLANRVQAKVRTPRSVFNVILSNGEKSDRTRFVINAKAVTGYEQGRDASKFASLVAVPQLYTIESGVQLAINERPLADGIVSLGMQIVEDGAYTLKLDTKADGEVWLIDSQTGTEVLLGGSEGYAFSSKAGTFDNRFKIRMANGETTGIAGIETENTKDESPVYDLQGRRTNPANKGVYIKGGKKVIVK